MSLAKLSKSVLVPVCFVAALGMRASDAKECYAPDARAQERAFSRAVTTEGGKVIWLRRDQTGWPNQNFEGQTREIFERA